MMFQMPFHYHFLFVWRSSVSHSFRADLSVSSPSFLKDDFYWIKNSGLTMLFFQNLENIFLFLLSFKFLRRNLLSFESVFQLIIHCFSLAVAVFKSFSLSFIFISLILCLGVKSVLFGVYSASRIYRFTSFTKFEELKPLFLQIVFSSVFFLFFWNFDNMNVRSSATIPHVPGYPLIF